MRASSAALFAGPAGTPQLVPTARRDAIKLPDSWCTRCSEADDHSDQFLVNINTCLSFASTALPTPTHGQHQPRTVGRARWPTFPDFDWSKCSDYWWLKRPALTTIRNCVAPSVAYHARPCLPGRCRLISPSDYGAGARSWEGETTTVEVTVEAT